MEIDINNQIFFMKIENTEHQNAVNTLIKSLIKDNPELADELEIKIKAHIKELADA